MPLSSAVRLCKVSLLVARDNSPLSFVISTLPWLWLRICPLCIHDICSTVTLTAAAVQVNVVLCVSPSATATIPGSGGVSIRGISVQEWRHAGEGCRWALHYTQECESTGLQSAANSQASILYYHAKMKSCMGGGPRIKSNSTQNGRLQHQSSG